MRSHSAIRVSATRRLTGSCRGDRIQPEVIEQIGIAIAARLPDHLVGRQIAREQFGNAHAREWEAQRQKQTANHRKLERQTDKAPARVPTPEFLHIPIETILVSCYR